MKPQSPNTSLRQARSFGLTWLSLAGSIFFVPLPTILAQTSGTTFSKEVADVFAGTLPPQQSSSTRMDIPGDFHKYYGQQVNQWNDSERKVAKIDLDMDLNYDGCIDNSDPADGGGFETTPPGCMIGVGEMTKCVIRVLPYRVDMDGEVVVTLEIAGINRGDASGEFASFEQETASVGHVRVWRDKDRKELLLDSSDPNRRFVEWFPHYHTYPYNMPNEVPRTVFVEGVGASPKYLGDLRLLCTVSQRAPGTKREQYMETRKKLLKSFRTTFDHILLTITKKPVAKEFINHNAEAVWWYPDSSGVLRLEK